MARITVEDDVGRKSPKWVPLKAATIRAQNPHIRTERAILNRFFAARALQVIEKSGVGSQLGWLRSRSTILAELRRIVPETQL